MSWGNTEDGYQVTQAIYSAKNRNQYLDVFNQWSSNGDRGVQHSNNNRGRENEAAAPEKGYGADERIGGFF